MRIAISSGHGKFVRGAAGPSPWGLDEVDEARRVVNRTAELLRSIGVHTEVFHDDVSQSQNENLNRIVNWHNARTRDLDISTHFNAYQTTSNPMGTECLYVTQNELAGKVSSKIAAAGTFLNRGPKKRTDLFFLNNTAEPAILVETCFVDSHADADLYRAHFEAICSAICEAISGLSPTAPPPEPEPEPPPIEVSGGISTITVTVDPPGSARVVITGAAAPEATRRSRSREV